MSEHILGVTTQITQEVIGYLASQFPIAPVPEVMGRERIIP
ncbi:hypothetical protein ACFQH8_16725 [Halomicroarcula sp. GCM10025710]